MKKVYAVIAALLLISILILSGCGDTTTPTTTSPTSEPTGTPTATTPEGPKTGGILRFGEVNPPPGSIGWPSDPMFAMSGFPVLAMIEPLITIDIDGNMQPTLATEWEVADDLQSITMTLRQGVKFHDGSDFNAEVAKWNIESMIAAHSSNLIGFLSVDVIDDYTIRINLVKYTNTIPYGLDKAYMVSKAAFDANGAEWMNANPVGTGPFKFVSYNQGVSLTVNKYEDYWEEGKPYLDGIEFHFIADPMTRTASFEAGEMDLISAELGKPEATLVEKGFEVISVPPAIFCVLPDSVHADSPLANIKVREAIEYAIDRDAIVDFLGYGFWETIYQYSLPNTPSYINGLEGRAYNPEKAMQLLDEAGYGDGLTINLYGNEMMGEDVIVAIQGFLDDVGIKADITMADTGVYREYQLNGWENGLLCSPFSVERNLNISLSFIWISASPFVAGIQKTAELDQIYADASATPDLEPELIQKATQYIYDTAMFIPLYTTCRGAVLQPFVHDTGLFSHSWIYGWDPAETWID